MQRSGPSLKTFNILINALALNNCKNVKAINVALPDAEGHVKLYTMNHVGSYLRRTIYVDLSNQHKIKPYHAIKVKALTFDSLINVLNSKSEFKSYEDR